MFFSCFVLTASHSLSFCPAQATSSVAGGLANLQEMPSAVLAGLEPFWRGVKAAQLHF